jgi:hypothetical protein
MTSCASYAPINGYDTSPASETPAVHDWDSVSFGLSRSICFGACPSYVVEITGDGTVNYCGRNFVKEIGKRKGKIDKTEVKTLFKKFKMAEFESLNDNYKARVTDLPSYDLRLTYDGTAKTVHDYGGAMIDMPPVVTELQNAVDAAANTAQWIGEADEKQHATHRVECGADIDM